MKRRTLPAAAALAATATLLLTACGGEDDSAKANDKIAGADTKGTKTASPSASASAARTVAIPGEVKSTRGAGGAVCSMGRTVCFW